MKIIIICSAVLLLTIMVEAGPVNEDLVDDDLSQLIANAGKNDPCTTKTTEVECNKCCSDLSMIADFSATPRDPLPMCDCPYRIIGPNDWEDDDEDDDEEVN